MSDEEQMKFNQAIQEELIYQRDQRRKFDHLLFWFTFHAGIIAGLALWRTL